MLGKLLIASTLVGLLGSALKSIPLPTRPALSQAYLTDVQSKTTPDQTEGTGTLRNVRVIQVLPQTNSVLVEDAAGVTTAIKQNLAVGSTWRLLQLRNGNVVNQDLDRPAQCGVGADPSTLHDSINNGAYGSCY